MTARCASNLGRSMTKSAVQACSFRKAAGSHRLVAVPRKSIEVIQQTHPGHASMDRAVLARAEVEGCPRCGAYRLTPPTKPLRIYRANPEVAPCGQYDWHGNRLHAKIAHFSLIFVEKVLFLCADCYSLQSNPSILSTGRESKSNSQPKNKLRRLSLQWTRSFDGGNAQRIQ